MPTTSTSVEGSKATGATRSRPDVLCPPGTNRATWSYDRVKASKQPFRLVVDMRDATPTEADSTFQRFVDLCKEDSLLSAAILEHNYNHQVTTFSNGTTVEFVS